MKCARINNQLRKEMVIQQNDKHACVWVEIDVEFVMDNIIIYEMWRLERIFKAALRFIWYYWAASVSYFCDLIWNVAKFKFQSMFRIITFCSVAMVDGWWYSIQALVRALYLLIGIPVAHISFEFYCMCWNRIRLVGNICMLFQEHRLRFNAHTNLFNFRSTSNLLIKNSLSNRLDYSAYIQEVQLKM